MSEKIFNDKVEKKPKKKRVLSDKQLESLRLGREKRKLKLLAKLNKQGEQDNDKQDKESRIKKSTLKKEQDKIKDELHKRKLLEKEEAAIKKNEYIVFKKTFLDTKNNLLEGTDDPKTFKAIKKFFKNIKLDNYSNIDDVKKKFIECMKERNSQK